MPTITWGHLWERVGSTFTSKIEPVVDDLESLLVESFCYSVRDSNGLFSIFLLDQTYGVLPESTSKPQGQLEGKASPDFLKYSRQEHIDSRIRTISPVRVSSSVTAFFSTS